VCFTYVNSFAALEVEEDQGVEIAQELDTFAQ